MFLYQKARAKAAAAAAKAKARPAGRKGKGKGKGARAKAANVRTHENLNETDSEHESQPEKSEGNGDGDSSDEDGDRDPLNLGEDKNKKQNKEKEDPDDEDDPSKDERGNLFDPEKEVDGEIRNEKREKGLNAFSKEIEEILNEGKQADVLEAMIVKTDSLTKVTGGEEWWAPALEVEKCEDITNEIRALLERYFEDLSLEVGSFPIIAKVSFCICQQKGLVDPTREETKKNVPRAKASQANGQDCAAIYEAYKGTSCTVVHSKMFRAVALAPLRNAAKAAQSSDGFKVPFALSAKVFPKMKGAIPNVIAANKSLIDTLNTEEFMRIAILAVVDTVYRVSNDVKLLGRNVAHGAALLKEGLEECSEQIKELKKKYRNSAFAEMVTYMVQESGTDFEINRPRSAKKWLLLLIKWISNHATTKKVNNFVSKKNL